MFICHKCKQYSKLGEKEEKVILKTRDKIYYKTSKRGVKYECSRGYEIVKEAAYCQECYKEQKVLEKSDDKL